MNSRASLSPQEERRFLAACAAGLPLLVVAIVLAMTASKLGLMLAPVFGVFMTLTVCSGPLMLLSVPCLAQVVGTVAICAWLWRVRSTAVGDWGWKVHLAISAVYVVGMYGVYLALDHLIRGGR